MSKSAVKMSSWCIVEPLREVVLHHPINQDTKMLKETDERYPKHDWGNGDNLAETSQEVEGLRVNRTGISAERVVHQNNRCGKPVHELREIGEKMVSRQIAEEVGKGDLTHCLSQFKVKSEPVNLVGLKVFEILDLLETLVGITDAFGDPPFNQLRRLSSVAFSIFVSWVIGRCSTASRSRSAIRQLLLFTADLLLSFNAQHTRTKGKYAIYWRFAEWLRRFADLQFFVHLASFAHFSSIMSMPGT
ncbi:hypothetical protein MTR67_039265 [Solanum verrucosum]|uniref:Uncharacterized protein n=1 Tax=Solanum verrucosum TaxID=315347 RepID=A0AAF0UGL5_SOLVR|nr:hypothetical protein MTR67_039265 [Solanum verrucosum]